jgi:serine protease Do
MTASELYSFEHSICRVLRRVSCRITWPLGDSFRPLQYNLFTMTKFFIGALLSVGVAIPSAVAAQTPARPAASNVLGDLNAAIEVLMTTVAPSVVQVLATGYRSVEDAGRGETGLVVGRQSSVGAGAVIDADGYIVTNAHVVAGAQQVRVVLPSLSPGAAPLQSLAAAYGTTVPARIIGVAQDIDLALIKVDSPGLRPLPLADYDRVRQGELVFAFGSPEGLRNSVTMGVISTPARQIDPDSPSVYVQTDAPINRGNSGGPLVNVKGELVGVNTFIFTQSGGSQGLGFAIPSVVIATAYPQLKKFGHLHRGIIGINVQGITPPIAEGLELSKTSGVIVSDVVPDSPAAEAGIQVRDVVTSVNGKPVDSVPVLMLTLSTRNVGDTVALGLVRESQPLTVSVPVVDSRHEIDQLSDLTDPEKNAIPNLGIIGVSIDDEIAKLLPDLRIQSGVLVIARRLESDSDSPLKAGDVIHAIGTFNVRSLDGLRVLLEGLKANSTVVLQIERDHRLMFTTMVVY